MSGNATTLTWQQPTRVQPTGQDLTCCEAAQLLDVPSETLAQWARQFAFPSAIGDESLPRFHRREIEALCATLPSAHSVEGAIREARRTLGC